jgi:hypothetical protein
LDAAAVEVGLAPKMDARKFGIELLFELTGSILGCGVE